MDDPLTLPAGRRWSIDRLAAWMEDLFVRVRANESAVSIRLID